MDFHFDGRTDVLGPVLPSDEVLVAVEDFGGALLDLLGNPVAELVVPGLGAVAHPHLHCELVINGVPCVPDARSSRI